MREVRQRVQVALALMGRVAATAQPRHVGGNVGGQRAFEQPGAQGRLQSRNLDHEGVHEVLCKRSLGRKLLFCVEQR